MPELKPRKMEAAIDLFAENPKKESPAIDLLGGNSIEVGITKEVDLLSMD